MLREGAGKAVFPRPSLFLAGVGAPARGAAFRQAPAWEIGSPCVWARRAAVRSCRATPVIAATIEAAARCGVAAIRSRSARSLATSKE
jgi:hypothetical protein